MEEERKGEIIGMIEGDVDWLGRQIGCLGHEITEIDQEVATDCNTALLLQKVASDKCDISCKRAKCVFHFHWRQWNIMMSYLTFLLVGWVFMHKIWPAKRAQ